MKKLLVLVLFLGAGLACGSWYINGPRPATVSADVFTFAPGQRGDMLEAVSATGTLQPTEVTVVSSPVGGRVLKLTARANDVVQAGEVLAELDARPAELQKKQAEDAVRSAQAYVDQATALENAARMAVQYQRDLKNAGGFRAELDKAQAEYDAARAGLVVAQTKLQSARTELERAEFALDQTHLKAPGDSFTDAGGSQRTYLVLERKLNVGQVVGPSSPEPLFTLAGNLEQMELHAEVVEGDVGKVKPALPVRFTVTSYDEPDRTFTGTLREIRPLPTNVRGAVYYAAVIDVLNEKNPATAEWRLRPGMTASVDVVLQQRPAVWQVPLAALNFTMEEGYWSPEARARLAEWDARPGRNDWRPVWVWQAEAKRVWPVFVRVTDTAKKVTGLQDGRFHEVLEWEPGYDPAAADLSFITSAPPARRPGLLDRPANLKLS